MLISDHDDLFFLYNFRPVQDYFSSYETGKSVTGGKGENPEKTNLHTQKQNLVYVTRDCKTDQLGSNLRRRVHCLGVDSCQNGNRPIVRRPFSPKAQLGQFTSVS